MVNGLALAGPIVVILLLGQPWMPASPGHHSPALLELNSGALIGGTDR